MPLPDLNVFCTQLAPGGRLCVTFPGGAELCIPFPDGKTPGLDELTNQLLGMVNAALMPLTPIFNIIDLLVALVNCIKAIEKALGPPPDPSKLAKCFPQLARALAKVLKLIPQLSIPVLIGGLLDVLIANLKGIRAVLLSIIRRQIRILASQARASALGSVQLQTAVDCAQGDLDAALVNLNENAKPLGRMINTLNALLALAGIGDADHPAIPSFATIGKSAEQAVAPIDVLIQAFTILRKGFP